MQPAIVLHVIEIPDLARVALELSLAIIEPFITEFHET